MHLDTDQGVLDRLVGGEGQSVDTAEDWSGTGTVPVLIYSLLPLLSMIVLLAMCTCKEQANSDKGEPMLNEISPITDRKSQGNSPHTVTSTHDEDEVKTTGNPRESRVMGNPRESRLSNGSASMIKEGPDNGRPKSHDQRALPEIPGENYGVMQTDDEEEVEGLYDIIRGQSRMNILASAAVEPPPHPDPTPTTSSTLPPLNLYEKVGDTGSDSTYAGVKDDSSDPDYPALKNISPYAIVEGIGNADYAHIDEKSKTNPRKLAALQRLKDLQATASTDTLNDSYASIPPPPVPDKHFSVSETSSGLTISIGGGGAVGPHSPQAPSPSLPPRNRTSSSGEDSAAQQSYSDNLMTDGEPLDDDVIDSVAPGVAPPGKPDPPYSCVTARESLANLRQRQAAELALKKPLPHDATYESVNYDQITSQTNPVYGSTTSDRNSMVSDLYAEIASGSGENSTRSSVYAKVGDVSNIREIPAPTPPPVDILKQLSIPKSDDEIPDPGYSIIRRSRPQSAHASLPLPPPDASPTEDGPLPLYAVVDKARRNRNTVCVSTADVNENLPGLANGVMPPQLYAQVHKLPQRPEHFPTHFPGAAYLGTGARPKVRDNAPTNNNPGVCSSNIVATSPLSHSLPPQSTTLEETFDPHYQTIPSDECTSDPPYDDIVDNQILEPPVEFDPNYERVGTDSMTRTRVTSPGVATEITDADMMDDHPHGMVHINQHHIDSNFWNRREHVYQEITSNTRDREKVTERRIHYTTGL